MKQNKISNRNRLTSASLPMTPSMVVSLRKCNGSQVQSRAIYMWGESLHLWSLLRRRPSFLLQPIRWLLHKFSVCQLSAQQLTPHGRNPSDLLIYDGGEDVSTHRGYLPGTFISKSGTQKFLKIWWQHGHHQRDNQIFDSIVIMINSVHFL